MWESLARFVDGFVVWFWLGVIIGAGLRSLLLALEGWMGREFFCPAHGRGADVEAPPSDQYPQIFDPDRDYAA